jgi:hypothetical protein
MAYRGFFTPRNPKKYAGNVSNIVYRSLWERRVMVMLDEDDSVLEWASEELIIPYRSPLDKRIHRYFVDFVYKVKLPNGSIVIKAVEVKPFAQTIEPIKGKKTTKKYVREVTTYLVNKAKWDAAEAYCKSKGWLFEKMTEKDIPGIIT